MLWCRAAAPLAEDNPLGILKLIPDGAEPPYVSQPAYAPATPPEYTVEALLNVLVSVRGSDLHVAPQASPHIRVNGQLEPVDVPPLSVEAVRDLFAQLCAGDERDPVMETMSRRPFVVHIAELGRFRVRALMAAQGPAFTVRRLPPRAVALSELGLVTKVNEFVDLTRGLILVAGNSGSGRTTTRIALTQAIAKARRGRIFTVEPTIEVPVLTDKGMVTQLDVGPSVSTYAEGIATALAHDADLISVGSIPDFATLSRALHAADSGLVIAEVDAVDSDDALATLVSFIPELDRPYIRGRLAKAFAGLIVQRLVLRSDEISQCVAMELCLPSTKVSDVMAGRSAQDRLLPAIIEGEYYGMQSLDSHLSNLVRDRVIASKTALHAASDRQALMSHLRTHSGHTG